MITTIIIAVIVVAISYVIGASNGFNRAMETLTTPAKPVVVPTVEVATPTPARKVPVKSVTTPKKKAPAKKAAKKVTKKSK